MHTQQKMDTEGCIYRFLHTDRQYILYVCMCVWITIIDKCYQFEMEGRPSEGLKGGTAGRKGRES